MLASLARHRLPGHRLTDVLTWWFAQRLSLLTSLAHNAFYRSNPFANSEHNWSIFGVTCVIVSSSVWCNIHESACHAAMCMRFWAESIHHWRHKLVPGVLIAHGGVSIQNVGSQCESIETTRTSACADEYVRRYCSSARGVSSKICCLLECLRRRAQIGTVCDCRRVLYLQTSLLEVERWRGSVLSAHGLAEDLRRQFSLAPDSV